jgi:hypothetical protein
MSDHDWRLNIGPASAELRKLRSSGLTIDAALDQMRGRGFTLPAVIAALVDGEGMDDEDVMWLLDERGDWDEF